MFASTILLAEIHPEAKSSPVIVPFDILPPVIVLSAIFAAVTAWFAM